MRGAMQRPAAWLVGAVCAQAAGVAVLAVLQIAAYVTAWLGEATAVGIGYAVLIGASAATLLLAMVSAYAAVVAMRAWKAVLVVAVAAPLVFVGVAELYATLAMLAIF